MNRFEHVAVFMGGWSAEREVSLHSGKAVYEALKAQNINVTALDIDRNILATMQQKDFSHVFIMLHGRGGEDGVIQGLLDVLQIPYTGTGVLGSALAMDKLRCKQLWKGVGLATPEFFVLQSEQDCEQALNVLGLPLMIKPVLEGSSIGISKVSHAHEMLAAWQLAKQCGGTVMAEKFIAGQEYTAAIVAGEVLPFIRLKTQHDFYDYQAKYISNDTQYICPCGLSDAEESRLAEVMLRAFSTLMCEDWGRVDFMLDADGNYWLIEVNTVPGMTDHSLVPMAASQAGMSFEVLTLKILQGACLHV